MGLADSRSRRSGFILLDLAVVLMIIVLLGLIQLSIMYRNQAIKEEQTSRKYMKWIAKAQELYYGKNGQYTERFRDLAPYVRNVDVFVDPGSGDLFRLWIDEVGRYQVESPGGYGSIVGGEPDWE
ncbi:MAG: type II secretion system protein [Candidatus Eisenbacteria bacterium]